MNDLFDLFICIVQYMFEHHPIIFMNNMCLK